MFKLKRSSNKQFYYTFTADNGEPLVTSETMHNRKDARKSINSLVWAIQRMGKGYLKNIVDETRVTKARPAPVTKEDDYKIRHFGTKTKWDHGSVWMGEELLYAW